MYLSMLRPKWIDKHNQGSIAQNPMILGNLINDRNEFLSFETIGDGHKLSYSKILLHCTQIALTRSV